MTLLPLLSFTHTHTHIETLLITLTQAHIPTSHTAKIQKLSRCRPCALHSIYAWNPQQRSTLVLSESECRLSLQQYYCNYSKREVREVSNLVEVRPQAYDHRLTQPQRSIQNHFTNYTQLTNPQAFVKSTSNQSHET